jgi:hypothetical protein
MDIFPGWNKLSLAPFSYHKGEEGFHKGEEEEFNGGLMSSLQKR